MLGQRKKTDSRRLSIHRIRRLTIVLPARLRLGADLRRRSSKPGIEVAQCRLQTSLHDFLAIAAKVRNPPLVPTPAPSGSDFRTCSEIALCPQTVSSDATRFCTRGECRH